MGATERLGPRPPTVLGVGCGARPHPIRTLSSPPPPTHSWRCLLGLRYFGKAPQIWALQAERVLCRCCQSKREKTSSFQPNSRFHAGVGLSVTQIYSGKESLGSTGLLNWGSVIVVLLVDVLTGHRL